MSAVQRGQPIEYLARRGYALAARRLAHYEELHSSGRWRRYFASHEQFMRRLREVIDNTRLWAKLAGRRPAAADASAERDGNKLRPAA